MREDVLIAPLDTWLIQGFGPLHRRNTVTTLLDQAHTGTPTAAPTALEEPTIAECDAKLARHRAATDAGAHPGVVAGWIAETQAEREHAERHQHTPVEEKTNVPTRYSEEQIIAVAEELGDLVAALRNAQPEHKLEVYRSLELHLTYDPETRTVRASVDLAAHRWDSVGVRGGIRTLVRITCAPFWVRMLIGYGTARIGSIPQCTSLCVSMNGSSHTLGPHTLRSGSPRHRRAKMNVQLSPMTAQSGAGEPPLSISAYGALQPVDVPATVAVEFFGAQCTRFTALVRCLRWSAGRRRLGPAGHGIS
ncbi:MULTISPECIES: hypothetical protein [unclassified Micromonospora]|uniref:hypothetical protein n=1 Tax=unclassified Micromonospora TaxID=2617518 RepID=UPI001C216C2C|nr:MULTISPECIES: hypothetical protein [unclassified Micromonospora]MBU8861766.1 hypothetical protein [Micromonospora sp. WMMB482]MDM4781344.1 hypothetical protein [Micromonospora sp. b486]